MLVRENTAFPCASAAILSKPDAFPCGAAATTRTRSSSARPPCCSRCSVRAPTPPLPIPRSAARWRVGCWFGTSATRASECRRRRTVRCGNGSTFSAFLLLLVVTPNHKNTAACSAQRAVAFQNMAPITSDCGTMRCASNGPKHLGSHARYNELATLSFASGKDAIVMLFGRHDPASGIGPIPPPAHTQRQGQRRSRRSSGAEIDQRPWLPAATALLPSGLLGPGTGAAGMRTGPGRQTTACAVQRHFLNHGRHMLWLAYSNINLLQYTNYGLSSIAYASHGSKGVSAKHSRGLACADAACSVVWGRRPADVFSRAGGNLPRALFLLLARRSGLGSLDGHRGEEEPLHHRLHLQLHLRCGAVGQLPVGSCKLTALGVVGRCRCC